MDKETNQSLDKIESQIEKLAAAMAESIGELNEGQQVLRSEMSLQNVAIEEELRSLRKELAQIPDQIDRIYGPTINEITDQIRTLQRTN